MNDRFIESREALSYARQALKNGSMAEARQWAERAAELAPQSEDPWLVLAAAVSPSESMEYIRKALEANPDSPRAKKGMEWAMQRVSQTPKAGASPRKQEQVREPVKSESVKNPKKRKLLPILLIVMGCAVFLFAAWSAVTSPVLASILNMAVPKAVQAPMHLQSFAQVDIAKPVVVDAPAIAQPTARASTPTATSQPEIASVAPTNTQQVVQAAVVPINTQIAEATDAPTTAANIVPSTTGSGGEHWIDVDLSQQRVYAYEGDTVVNSFIVSTGTWQTPTVTGQYHVWIKLLSTPMSGPGYYLPGVPYTMYFYKGYALHGTYWHNNFGTPMSHGCVNLSIPDSEWLYNFSSVGTLVNVHY